MPGCHSRKRTHGLVLVRFATAGPGGQAVFLVGASRCLVGVRVCGRGGVVLLFCDGIMGGWHGIVGSRPGGGDLLRFCAGSRFVVCKFANSNVAGRMKHWGVSDTNGDKNDGEKRRNAEERGGMAGG